MDNPLVTVLITGYNSKPNYLNCAINSALNQDYKNVEVLVVDDGSEPKLEQMIERKGDPRLRYVYQKNQGLPFGLIKGMKLAKGKYVAILDHDDSLTDGSIRKRVDKIRENNVGLVYGDAFYVDREGKTYCHAKYGDCKDFDEFARRTVIGLPAPYKHSGVLFEKDAVLNAGNYDPDLKCGYDNDLILRVAKSNGFSHISEPVVFYRTHGENTSLNFDYRIKGMKYRFRIIDKNYESKLERFNLKTKTIIVNVLKGLYESVIDKKYQHLTRPSLIIDDIFYKKHSLGKNSKPIEIIKFKTMKDINDNISISNDCDEFGNYKDNSRVTRFGRFLRKYWIDEIPQIVNLLKGDIKLFGIRPMTEKKWELYPEELKEKALKQKPGWVGIQYAAPRSEGNFETHTRFLTKYVEEYERYPIITDMKYGLKTINNIIFKKVRSS